jgi:hypothetical protein
MLALDVYALALAKPAVVIDAGLIAAMYYHAITCSSTLPKRKGADFKVCAFPISI